MRSLTEEGAGSREIHQQIEKVYGEYRMPLSRVQEWIKRFFEGRVDWSTETCHKPACFAKVDEFVKKDHRATVGHISAAAWLSHGTVHAIILDTLNIRKVCTQWIPHILTPEEEAYRVAMCLYFQQRYNDSGGDFLSIFITSVKS